MGRFDIRTRSGLIYPIIQGEQAISFQYLLDLYGSAAVAYSLRKLRVGYTGSAIRIRRSSDNTESDIGFASNNQLDTGAINSFAGSGNAFVTKWYDQSGNGRDAIQPTAANQPIIQTSGVVITNGGKPAIENTSSTFLYTSQTAFTTLQTHSDFIVLKGKTQSQPGDYTGYLVFGPSSGNDFLNANSLTINTGAISGGKNLDLGGAPGYTIISAGLVTTFRLITHIITSNSGQAWQNALSVATSSATFSSTNSGSLYIGTRYIGSSVQTTSCFIGYYQEIVSYNLSQSANRTNIESNINTFYTIY